MQKVPSRRVMADPSLSFNSFLSPCIVSKYYANWPLVLLYMTYRYRKQKQADTLITSSISNQKN